MSTIQTPEKNKEVVRKLYQDFLNTGRLELLDQMIAQDYVGPFGPGGPTAFAEPVQALLQGFPDIHWTIQDLVAEGDQVAVRWSWQGTHTKPFRGIAPSHKQVTDSAIAIYQLKDNKIIRAWIQTDRLGFLQQIGVVSPDVVPVPQLQKIQ